MAAHEVEQSATVAEGLPVSPSMGPALEQVMGQKELVVAETL